MSTEKATPGHHWLHVVGGVPLLAALSLTVVRYGVEPLNTVDDVFNRQASRHFEVGKPKADRVYMDAFQGKRSQLLDNSMMASGVYGCTPFDQANHMARHVPFNVDAVARYANGKNATKQFKKDFKRASRLYFNELTRYGMMFSPGGHIVTQAQNKSQYLYSHGRRGTIECKYQDTLYFGDTEQQAEKLLAGGVTIDADHQNELKSCHQRNQLMDEAITGRPARLTKDATGLDLMYNVPNRSTAINKEDAKGNTGEYNGILMNATKFLQSMTLQEFEMYRALYIQLKENAGYPHNNTKSKHQFRGKANTKCNHQDPTVWNISSIAPVFCKAYTPDGPFTACTSRNYALYNLASMLDTDGKTVTAYYNTKNAGATSSGNGGKDRFNDDTSGLYQATIDSNTASTSLVALATVLVPPCGGTGQNRCPIQSELAVGKGTVCTIGNTASSATFKDGVSTLYHKCTMANLKLAAQFRMDQAFMFADCISSNPEDNYFWNFITNVAYLTKTTGISELCTRNSLVSALTRYGDNEAHVDVAQSQTLWTKIRPYELNHVSLVDYIQEHGGAPLRRSEAGPLGTGNENTDLKNANGERAIEDFIATALMGFGFAFVAFMAMMICVLPLLERADSVNPGTLATVTKAMGFFAAVTAIVFLVFFGFAIRAEQDVLGQAVQTRPSPLEGNMHCNLPHNDNVIDALDRLSAYSVSILCVLLFTAMVFQVASALQATDKSLKTLEKGRNYMVFSKGIQFFVMVFFATMIAASTYVKTLADKNHFHGVNKGVDKELGCESAETQWADKMSRDGVIFMCVVGLVFSALVFFEVHTRDFMTKITSAKNTLIFYWVVILTLFTVVAYSLWTYTSVMIRASIFRGSDVRHFTDSEANDDIRRLSNIVFAVVPSIILLLCLSLAAFIIMDPLSRKALGLPTAGSFAHVSRFI